MEVDIICSSSTFVSDTRGELSLRSTPHTGIAPPRVGGCSNKEIEKGRPASGNEMNLDRKEGMKKNVLCTNAGGQDGGGGVEGGRLWLRLEQRCAKRKHHGGREVATGVQCAGVRGASLR